MNEERPYKEFPPEQLNDLPLPDEEQSWQKMKQLLDKDDDDRVPPPIWFRGCTGWIVLLGLLGALWLVFRPDQWLERSEGERQRVERQKEKGGRDEGERSKAERQKDTFSTPAVTPAQPVQPGTTGPGEVTVPQQEEIPPGEATHRTKNNTEREKAEGKGLKERGLLQRAVPPVRGRGTKKDNTGVPQRGTRQADLKPGNTKHKPNNTQQKPPKEKQTTDSGTVVKQTVPPQATSPIIPAKDSTATAKATEPVKKVEPVLSQTATDSSTQTSTARKEEDKEKNYYFSAGLALQQQIPFAGQKANPYDYYGRKGSLADYIPSVYLRFHQDRKWFLQSEFRYGAPQSVKEITYGSRSFSDTGNVITTTTAFRLKKTFFHQLPVSFNYFVRPNWSVGAGVMYSKFHSAVSEETVRLRNNQLQRDSLVSQKIVYVPRDSSSVFTSSQLHALIETQYQWKRFSFGLRYTQGLLPFIRYTEPNGVLREEKNRSLQAFIRFRIWNSE
ncbi:MAG TPA: hypothetical protein VGB46_03515 [Flavisolibacter sp.]|jgi:hypothetical protein